MLFRNNISIASLKIGMSVLIGILFSISYGQVPNGGFEENENSNWLILKDWYSANNTAPYQFVYYDTLSCEGSFAVKSIIKWITYVPQQGNIYSYSPLRSGTRFHHFFEVNFRPNSIKGCVEFYKPDIGNVSFQILVEGKVGNDTIELVNEIYQQSSNGREQIDLSFPNELLDLDSVSIEFNFLNHFVTNGHNNGAYFIVDDIHFGYGDCVDACLSLYPNPSSGNTNINLDSENAEELEYPYILKVTDETGRIVSETTMYSNFTQLDLSNQSIGCYFVSLWKDENMIDTQKLLRQD